MQPIKYLLLFLLPILAQGQDSITIRKIYDYALTDSKAYERLNYLCNEIGPRLSGSKGATAAVLYTQKQLIAAGADSVWLQPCMVTSWERGIAEKAWMIADGKKSTLQICALGGSIATPSTGLEAEVIEVYDFEALKKLGRNGVEGKIVFLNHPMNPKNYNTYASYGECGTLRYNGAKEAARYGAVGFIVRSLASSITTFPHTGVLAYGDSIVKIPACAISTLDAEKLSAALKNSASLKVGFSQSCKINKDVPSYNVIAEIRGSEFPNEIILAGAHLDSWDLATGAHDDGTGVVQCMDLISTFKEIGLTPKRTIRCVLFMDEENGGKGAVRYAAIADSLHENHIVAIETDGGGFTPRGFSFEGDSTKIAFAKQFKILLQDYGLSEWKKGYSGTDIRPLTTKNTLLIGFLPDSQRYFEIHHNAADTFDNVNKRELQLGGASIISLVWLFSEHGIKNASGN